MFIFLFINTATGFKPLNSVLLIILMGLILGIVTMVVVFQQKRQLVSQLELQKDLMNYQQELLQASILAQEMEKERVALNLHDRMGGLLSTTNLFVQNLHPKLKEEQFQLYQERALAALNQNIEEVRMMTNDLFPQTLEKLGIITATRATIYKLVERHDLKAHVLHNKDVRFDKNREKVLFRILQELIDNTVKYASAKNISLDFNFMPNQLECFYKDDGQGFDWTVYEVQADHCFFGLKNIASRTAFLKGQMTYDTAPGKGVEVHISIPL